jgi:hypothetical protein
MFGVAWYTPNGLKLMTATIPIILILAMLFFAISMHR